MRFGKTLHLDFVHVKKFFLSVFDIIILGLDLKKIDFDFDKSFYDNVTFK